MVPAGEIGPMVQFGGHGVGVFDVVGRRPGARGGAGAGGGGGGVGFDQGVVGAAVVVPVLGAGAGHVAQAKLDALRRRSRRQRHAE